MDGSIVFLVSLIHIFNKLIPRLGGAYPLFSLNSRMRYASVVYAWRASFKSSRPRSSNISALLARVNASMGCADTNDMKL